VCVCGNIETIAGVSRLMHSTTILREAPEILVSVWLHCARVSSTSCCSNLYRTLSSQISMTYYASVVSMCITPNTDFHSKWDTRQICALFTSAVWVQTSLSDNLQPLCANVASNSSVGSEDDR
jgi:hypothetical protein